MYFHCALLSKVDIFLPVGWKRRSAENGVRSVENAECEENVVCGNAEYGKCRVCGNVLTWTELLISKHFNAFIRHKKCFEMFYY